MTNLVAPVTEFGLSLINVFSTVGRSILALVIGPMVGFFDSIQKFDPKHPFDSLLAMNRAMWSTTKEALEGLAQLKEAEDKAAEARKARLQKGASGGFDDEGTGEKDGKGSEIDIAKETEKIRARIEEEKRRGHLAELTNTAKILELKKEVAELEAKSAAIAGQSQSEDKAKAELGLEIAKRKNDLSAAERSEEADRLRKETAKTKPEPTQAAAHNMVNSLQQIGGFLGSYQSAPEVAMLDTARKSENHLSQIKKHIERIAAISTRSAGSDAGF